MGSTESTNERSFQRIIRRDAKGVLGAESIRNFAQAVRKIMQDACGQGQRI
ncbi:MAG: hypothetical protein LBG24_11340 [Treponema sp.]|nr:hypothetical protein [Treponema sp.]